jgi:hypothetical protein
MPEKIEVWPCDRNGQPALCFEITIQLPKLKRGRKIIRRDQRGRIMGTNTLPPTPS